MKGDDSASEPVDSHFVTDRDDSLESAASRQFATEFSPSQPD